MANAIRVSVAARNDSSDAMSVIVRCVERLKRRAINVTIVAVEHVYN